MLYGHISVLVTDFSVAQQRDLRSLSLQVREGEREPCLRQLFVVIMTDNGAEPSKKKKCNEEKLKGRDRRAGGRCQATVYTISRERTRLLNE